LDPQSTVELHSIIPLGIHRLVLNLISFIKFLPIFNNLFLYAYHWQITIKNLTRN